MATRRDKTTRNGAVLPKISVGQIIQEKLYWKERRVHAFNSGTARGSVFDIRNRLNLSQEKFAHLIGVTQRTVWRWEQQLGQPDQYSSEFLTRLNNIVDLLLLNLEPREAIRWLDTPNPDLRGYSPIESARSGFGADTVQDLARRVAQQLSS